MIALYKRLENNVNYGKKINGVDVTPLKHPGNSDGAEKYIIDLEEYLRACVKLQLEAAKYIKNLEQMYNNLVVENNRLKITVTSQTRKNKKLDFVKRTVSRQLSNLQRSQLENKNAK